MDDCVLIKQQTESFLMSKNMILQRCEEWHDHVDRTVAVNGHKRQGNRNDQSWHFIWSRDQDKGQSRIFPGSHSR